MLLRFVFSQWTWGVLIFTCLILLSSSAEEKKLKCIIRTLSGIVWVLSESLSCRPGNPHSFTQLHSWRSHVHSSSERSAEHQIKGEAYKSHLHSSGRQKQNENNCYTLCFSMKWQYPDRLKTLWVGINRMISVTGCTSGTNSWRKIKNDYWFLFLQTSSLFKVSQRFCFWAKTASSFQIQKQWASIYRYLGKPFKPLQSDKGIPQCNWQDSINQLRKTTNGHQKYRTERVKTNKASKQQSLTAVSLHSPRNPLRGHLRTPQE